MNRLRLRTSCARTDDGFTLIEMVIAILILGFLLAPLVSSYILGLGTATSTAQAVANSSDAELVAGYFQADVSGAVTVSPGDTSGVSCGGGGTILQTKSVDLSLGPASPATYVSYVLSENTDAETSLHLAAGTVDQLDRVACDASGTQTASTTLARTIAVSPPSPFLAPTVTCDGAPCTNNSKPLTVSLTLTEYEYEKLTPPTPTAPFAFTVSGERRVTA